MILSINRDLVTETQFQQTMSTSYSPPSPFHPLVRPTAIALAIGALALAHRQASAQDQPAPDKATTS